MTARPKTLKRSRTPGVWQIQEAKEGLHELIERVKRGEEQVITLGGEPVARVVPADTAPKAESLAEFIRSSPLYGVKLDLRRDKSLPRKIDL
jgi:antitoxin Phd